MRILVFFIGLFLLASLSYAQTGKNKKKSAVQDSKALWTKQDLLMFHQSWIVEELQFPETLEEAPAIAKQEEVLKKETSPPPTKIQFTTETQKNPILQFISENLKLILIGIAILTFALYRLRYGSSSYKPGGKIFSKFKDK